jgi:DNA-directed RNA polymerase subunit F
MLSRDIMDLRVQANILEAMQQRIIISSPELRKQYDRMFSEVEAEILGKLEEDLDKTKKGMEKLDKGIKELIPKNKGLRLDLDRSGEYPI